ncbi:MAG: flagellar hook-basal body complex protein FliE [Oscillospiraceae bacterium]|jgi:flagellar hook-basal body complex protein FliE|nr:flagellar hook-basal body complex protein FliE [Oscillospiraceae bacterium]
MAINFQNPYISNNYTIIPSISTAGNTQEIATGTVSDNAKFSNLLAAAMGDTVSTDAESKIADLGLITGNSEDIHNLTIASTKADIMLNLTVQIRNRMVEGYQEIMRMQI